jgi:hypothetical protein
MTGYHRSVQIIWVRAVEIIRRRTAHNSLYDGGALSADCATLNSKISDDIRFSLLKAKRQTIRCIFNVCSFDYLTI